MKKRVKSLAVFIGTAMLLMMTYYIGCDVWPQDTFKLQAIGGFQYHLKVNIKDNADFFADQAYVVGWEGDWDLLIPMDLADKEGWAEIVLEAEDLGVKSFVICNEDQTKWLWIDEINHPLVVPARWIDSSTEPNEKVLAFEVDSSESFRFLLFSTVSTTITIENTSKVFFLEALGDYQYLLRVNIKDHSHIAIDDAYVVGWEGDWDLLISMDLADKEGWAEIVLESEDLGVKSFVICNENQTEWLWIDEINHPLVVPTRWIDDLAGTDEKVLAFIINSSDSFEYLDGPIDNSTTTSSTDSTVPVTTTTTIAINNDALSLQALGDNRYELTVNVAVYSNIAVSQAKLIGWKGNWDQPKPMEVSVKEGWVKKTLETSSLGVKYFTITNAAKSEWLWTPSINHPLVVPTSWIVPGSNPSDKVIAFDADSADSYKYIEAPVASTSTTTVIGPEVVYFDPRFVTVPRQSEFTISLKVKDVQDIFGLAFDLNFDPLLVEYISFKEGSLLEQNCQTIMMIDVNSSGNIVVGVTRLGAECGGVSGPGQVADFTFRALNSQTETDISFSDYNFCILKDQDTGCSFSPKGSWSSALVKIQ